MSNFDLTEKNGLNKAINYIKGNKFLSIYFLPYTLAYDGFNKLLSSSDKNIDQAKTVEQLIEKGKKNGVKKMISATDPCRALHSPYINTSSI